MPQNLQQDILKELGIDQLPPERQEEILTVMTELLLKRITVRVLENLNAEQRQAFETVTAGGDPERVSDFFSQNVSGYEQIAQDEIAKFRTEMAEMVNALLA